MARAPKRYNPDQLFNPDGFRHYRRAYSHAELRWGLSILLGLIAILSWVLYRGARPDPALFAALTPMARNPPKIPTSTANGVFPKDLTPPGWRAGVITSFDTKDVYKKINGRESYYKSFGFQRLDCVRLSQRSSSATIDLELFDQEQPQNALGAYAGERGEGQVDRVTPGGVARVVRNALYLVRGRYYLRAVGSDESAATLTALKHIEARFVGAKGAAKGPGQTLPWGYTLLAKVGIGAGAVTYERENAFSFEFAKDVYAGRLGKDGPQLFVMAAASPEAAKTLAAQFHKSFSSYGDAVGKQAPGWVKDHFIGAFSTASAIKRFVVGVRAAPKLAPAQKLLVQLEQALPAENTDDEDM
ncbi:MAG: hypothetical protein JRH20_07095 [Deltaproteobacteria bacterium]|nr:hypothetical protein [Deltaproteobacteria bacterium]